MQSVPAAVLLGKSNLTVLLDLPDLAADAVCGN